METKSIDTDKYSMLTLKVFRHVESSLELHPFVFLSVLGFHKQIHLQGHAWRYYISSSIYKNSNILLFKDKWFFFNQEEIFKQCDATYWILMKVSNVFAACFRFSRNRFTSSHCNELAETFCQRKWLMKFIWITTDD